MAYACISKEVHGGLGPSIVQTKQLLRRLKKTFTHGVVLLGR